MQQSSGDLSVYTKSIRISERIGLPRVWEADYDAEICLIFMKNGTNCSMMFHSWNVILRSVVQFKLPCKCLNDCVSMLWIRGLHSWGLYPCKFRCQCFVYEIIYGCPCARCCYRDSSMKF